jgi:hypothetical protein
MGTKQTKQAIVAKRIEDAAWQKIKIAFLGGRSHFLDIF